MPTINAGSVATVYCPIAGSVTITPGSAGRVTFQARGFDGGQSSVPRTIYAAESVAVAAGDTVSIQAVGSAATYTTPAGADTSLSSLVSGGGKSPNGIQRLHLSMPIPPAELGVGAAARMYDVQIPAKRAFRGVRFVLMNLNTAAVMNITAMRCGSAPKHLSSYGNEITWWPNLLTVGGNSAIAVPAAVAGATANHVVPGFAITDFVPLQPVARTDTPTGKPLVRVRARTAAELQYPYQVGSGYAPAWNAFVGADGMLIGSVLTTGDFATSAPTDATYYPTENGGFLNPVIALFSYDTPGVQVWAFGDSLFQGVGSSVGATAGAGVLGWPTRVHVQQSTIDVLNMAVAGQKTADSIAIMKRMVNASDDLPAYACIKVYSPNDGSPTQALIDASWGMVLDAVSFLRTKGIVPVLFTSPPVNSWNATQHGFNEAQNARAFALAASMPTVKVVDMATVIADPANPRTILPAYLYTTDALGTHYLDAGHQAIADAAVRVLMA